MSAGLIAFVIVLVAFIFAGIDLVRERAQSLTTWAVFLLALAWIIERNFGHG
jgi:hypothetical protein